MTVRIGEAVVVARAPVDLDRAAGGWGRWQFPRLGRLADGRLHASFSIEPDSYASAGKASGHAYSSDGGLSWTVGGPLPPHEADDGMLLPGGDRLKPVELPPGRAEELGGYRRVCEFTCSYGYPRTLLRAADLPPDLASWRFARLPAGGGRWVEETALIRIPEELRCVVQEKRGAGPAGTGVLPRPFLQGKMRLAPDGSLWAASYEWRLQEGRPRYAPLFLRSTDGGRRWDLVGEIRYRGDTGADPHAAVRDGFTEPDWCWAPDGSIVCLMRSMDGHGHGPLYVARSDDGGASWSTPEAFDTFGKMPQLLRLGCGATLASYGASGGPGFFVVRASGDSAGRIWSDPVRTPVSPVPAGAWDSCGHTEMVALDETSALVVSSDFNRPDDDGLPRKTILVRRIEVSPAS